MKVKLNNKSLVSLSLIILGFILLLKYSGIISAAYEGIYGFVFAGYGLVAVYILSGSGNKGGLFTAGVIFILGVLFIVLENYEILSPVKLLLPSVLFAVGTGSALLFLDDYREKVFLIISLIMIAAGILTTFYFDLFTTIQAANRITLVIFQYWPVIFVLIGFSIILNRNRV
jgi:hypothetical protein